MMLEGDVLPQEVIMNPFYSIVQKSKKMHLNLRLKSFRQINKYYEEIGKSIGNDSFKFNKK